MFPRTVLLDVIRGLGLMKFWQHAHRSKVSILKLHGVFDRQAVSCRLLNQRLSVKDFSRYIGLLKRCFNIVSLREACKMISGSKPIRPYSLVLTFDDGYLNNATHAWPVLRNHGVTATFFIPTGYVGTGRTFWSDRLDHAIRHLPTDMEFLSVNGTYLRVSRKDPDALFQLFWQAKRICVASGWREAERIVADVERCAASTLGDSTGYEHWAGLITWEHIRQMQAEGADFGSHTVCHCPLDELNLEAVAEELTKSKSEIETHTGIPCWSIAYPRGRFTPSIVKLARSAGYRCGLTTLENSASVGATPLMLPRVGLPDRSVTSAELLARATGLSVAMSRLWHRDTKQSLQDEAKGM